MHIRFALWARFIAEDFDEVHEVGVECSVSGVEWALLRNTRRISPHFALAPDQNDIGERRMGDSV